jgi:hypothetical protein
MSDKYANYFDDDKMEVEETPKVIKASPNKKEDCFQTPLPKSKSRTPNKNENIATSVNTMRECIIQEHFNPHEVEKYNSMHEFQEAHNDDEYEYEMVDLNELKNHILSESKLNTIKMSPEEEVDFLEKELAKNQSDYNVLYKLIVICRENKFTEKMKHYRNITQLLYPLSDDMWKEWINDEYSEILLKYNNNENISQEDRVKLFEEKYSILIPLFKRALDDFYCKIIFYFF